MAVHSNAQGRSQSDSPLYQDDGLLDIFVGLGVLLAGLFLAARMPWLVAILPTSLGPACYAAQKSLAAHRSHVPRTQVLSPKRVSRLLVLVVFFGVLALLLGIAAALGWQQGILPTWARAQPAAVPALGLGVPVVLALTVAAAVLRAPRFYAYATLSTVAFVGGYLAGWQVWWSVVVTGTVVVAGGLASLKLFLGAHPRMTLQ